MIRFFLLAALLPAFSSAKRPNAPLIMADDVESKVSVAMGVHLRNPHIDKLAQAGLLYPCHSQPLCTPTRIQIMTGRYNHRNWTYFGILDPKENFRTLDEEGLQNLHIVEVATSPYDRRTSPMPIGVAWE